MKPKSQKLSTFFESVPKPRYLLGTTYTMSLAFFESMVFPYIDDSELRHCLIISDPLGYRRALAEAPALVRADREYLVVPAPTDGSFHCKVWLMMSEDAFALMAGSGNLTQSGFIGNAEMFDAVYYSHEEPPSQGFRADIETFLAGLKGMWKRGAPGDTPLCVEMLDAMLGHIRRFPTDRERSGEARLLHSFRAPLIEQMPPGRHVKRVHIAAPFFGGNMAGIAGLKTAYPAADFRVFPAEHSGGTIDLPLSKARQTIGKENVKRLDLGDRAARFAHLKLYGFEGGDDASWIYCTSANCTEAAWKGRNVEAGLLRPLPRDRIAAYFREDRKGRLPEELRPQIFEETERGSGVRFTAIESAGGVQIIFDAPLVSDWRAVRVSVRSASTVGFCSYEEIARGTAQIFVPWDRLSPVGDNHRATLTVEFSGTFSDGKQVGGAVFVENSMLLTAEPGSRSAYRGALSLLTAEGLPPYSDFAALFSLVDNILTGRSVEADDGHGRGRRDKDEPAVQREDSGKLAIWPPQPSVHSRGLASMLGTQGRILWGQRIIEAFLSQSILAPSGGEDSTDDSDESVEPDPRPVSKYALNAAQKMWKEAAGVCERGLTLLQEMIPTKERAANVWGGATFLFLATLATRKVATRSAFSSGDVPPVAQLAERFLRAMFDHRPQDDGGWSGGEERYRYRTFPPLSDDLFSICSHPLHYQLADVFFAAQAGLDLERSVRSDPAVARWIMMKEVSRFDGNMIERTQKSCLALWRRFFLEGSEGFGDETFLKALHSGLGTTWHDHSGFARFEALRSGGDRVGEIDDASFKRISGMSLNVLSQFRRGQGRFLRMNPCVDYCSQSKCSRAYQVTPQLKTLAGLNLIVCQGCGTLLVPAPLWDAYEVMHASFS